MTKIPEYDETWGEAFIARMREHMEQLHDSVYNEDYDAPEPFTLSGVPFCGCEDCDERERYLLAIILTIEGYEAGKVKLVDAE